MSVADDSARYEPPSAWMIATISNGFVLLGIGPYDRSIIKHSIAVAALALDTGLTGQVRAK
jgi:predicted ABC-type sugar transport system permease subunit